MSDYIPPAVAAIIAGKVAAGGLDVADLEALPVGDRVHRISDPGVVYTRIDPAGPSGPWRRYETGIGPVTCKSTTLAMIGVRRCE